MRVKLILLPLLAALCVPSLTRAQFYEPYLRRDDPRFAGPRGLARGEGPALVTYWIGKYLNRAPNATDLEFGRAMDAGARDVITELANIFACEEYYIRAGYDDRRFVEAVFRDVTGRQPSDREREFWGRRLSISPEGMEGRDEIARALLNRYPPALPRLNVRPAEPFDYRRPPEPYDYRRQPEPYRD